MRPDITKEEISQLNDDVNLLKQNGFLDDEVYDALRILELRRQTGKMEFIKRALFEKKTDKA
ncbi:hypothetical protein BIY26_19830 [Brenneria goodwinii]|uniref:Uncharacterized protein n=1 Tax=Brenneria goodwinii TaxID=1109412 RepID=A0A0G4JXG2_9GAMM|nr:hypothetical protein [Brenneria goodwinii]ATA23129.1 hypothetical protein AWC36_02865 [Brenneria goodwinii]MCG8157415.1 hypothetical protein [Brenneria goodwinii]MCG8161988.1 hypothetical protein [Brenneria goodwinii]MCG8165229.1 hypothetical protein [Brenneria goodwinii]MCG8170926.1 hypothetical protein [Brenneria goodwinii]